MHCHNVAGVSLDLKVTLQEGFLGTMSMLALCIQEKLLTYFFRNCFLSFYCCYIKIKTDNANKTDND